MEAATKSEQQEQRENGDGNVGTVEEIQGVVIEVAFPDDLPEIYNALEVDLERYGDEEREDTAGTGRLVLEVQQHLGDDRVRAVAMDATDGLARSSRRASRSSTCWRPTRRAARSACSAAPASARPC